MVFLQEMGFDDLPPAQLRELAESVERNWVNISKAIDDELLRRKVAEVLR